MSALKYVSPTGDRGGFRLSCVRLPEYRHLLYLLFWPAFGLRYLLIENCNPADFYHPVHCALDDVIPFEEIFIIPYFFWYVCIIGTHIWLLVHDVSGFKRYSRYLIVSMSISTTIFLLYPTCQYLRPEQFPRDNGLTDIVRFLYRMDTSTNVCPSEHVIGSAGFFLAACHSKKLRKPGRITMIGIIACLTAVATVFLKQHSLVDVAAAIPVCAAAWYISGRPGPFAERGSMRRRLRNKIITDSSSA